MWTRSWIRRGPSTSRLTFFLGNLISFKKNKYTCGWFKEWINTVFQMISKSVGRETEWELRCPRLFHRSEALQQAEAPSTKNCFRQAELFGWVESRNLLKSGLLNESWKFEYYTVHNSTLAMIVFIPALMVYNYNLSLVRHNALISLLKSLPNIAILYNNFQALDYQRKIKVQLRF